MGSSLTAVAAAVSSAFVAFACLSATRTVASVNRVRPTDRSPESGSAMCVAAGCAKTAAAPTPATASAHADASGPPRVSAALEFKGGVQRRQLTLKGIEACRD